MNSLNEAALGKGRASAPRDCREQPLVPPGSWRGGSPAIRRNTISPLMGGFRGKKSRLALQGQFLLSTGVLRRKPNVVSAILLLLKFLCFSDARNQIGTKKGSVFPGGNFRLQKGAGNAVLGV